MPYVAVELTDFACGRDPLEITRAIQRRLRSKVNVAYPAAVTSSGRTRSATWLVDGYVFVAHDPALPYYRLMDQRLTHSAVYVDGAQNKIALVSDAEVEALVAQARTEADGCGTIEVGAEVVVTSGAYCKIPGRVVADIPEHDAVTVEIQLRSTQRLVSLPRAFLRLQRSDEAPYPRSWADASLPPLAALTVPLERARAPRGRRARPPTKKPRVERCIGAGARLLQALADRPRSELAHSVDRTESTISHWITENAGPLSIHTVTICAKALGISVAWLAYGEGEMIPENKRPSISGQPPR